MLTVKTTKADLVWTRRKARLSLQNCASGTASSPWRLSEEKLNGRCEIMDALLHG
ncbi:hypothetical protein DPMN_056766 [Dreissena polymorpha]|uniref:Uncharacterized protein n=1 Tax=Dreissena polymorpha TaxID=45954 RepID=A0A9D4CSA9_DREPO|nr:hypothetical protein DPMN_056766 [Dreissena polymorpha]